MPKDMTEAERRIRNLASVGQVVEIDAEKARVRVKSGDITSTWLPFAASRAGQDRFWHPPEPGEQVLVVSPGGDTNLGVVMGSLYRDVHPAPGDSIEVSRTEYKDGAFLQYDRENHEYTLDVPAGGKILLKIGDSTLEMTAEGIKLTAIRIDMN